MKKLIAILFACAFGLAAYAQTEKWVVQSIANPISTSAGTTYTCTPGAVTNFASTAIIDCRKQDYVGIQATCISSNAAVSNVTFRFVHSMDGSTYTSVGQDLTEFLWTVYCGKTTVTNIQTKGLGYIKFISVSNDCVANGALTNLVLKYVQKITL